jgi:enoyl-CoA hydratase/carnithine racemase
MVLTGDYITARQALDWGYVDEVVPAEKLEETAIEWARKLARKSPVALKLMKMAFWQTQDMTPGEALPHIEEIFARHAASEAGQEAIRAFLEKRAPSWLVDEETN